MYTAFGFSCIRGSLRLVPRITLIVILWPQPPADEAGDGEGAKGHDEEEEEEIPPTPVPKEWECLGSDLEIKETFLEPGRPLVRGC